MISDSVMLYINDNMFEHGIIFGYSRCCTSEFLQVYHVSRFLKIHPINFRNEKRKLSGSGFIPCKQCDKKHYYRI